MSSLAKLGICQIAVEEDKTVNIAKAQRMIERAVQSGCSLVILPEMFNCPYTAELFPRYAEMYPSGPTLAMLADTAAKHRVIIVGGSVPERDNENRIYNSCFIFGVNGELLARHRKVHLFDVDIKGGTVFQESKTLTAGADITVIPDSLFTFGVAICYDIRFPELARKMTLMGAKVLIYPAAFGPVTGPAHWELLLRSRALDNQVYVIGAAPAKNPAAEYQAYGHSAIADPWGRISVMAGEEETLLVWELDFTYMEKVRAELPLLKHRRPEVYML